LTPSFKGNPRTQGHETLSRKKPDTRDFRCRRFDTVPGCDGWIDGRTDGQTPRPWLKRAKHSAIALKNGRPAHWKTSEVDDHNHHLAEIKADKFTYLRGVISFDGTSEQDYM